MGFVDSCSDRKACSSDYLSIAVTAITSFTIFLGVCFLWWKRHTPEVKAKQVSLLVVQGFGSILWLISLLVFLSHFILYLWDVCWLGISKIMTRYASRFDHHGQWLTCYFWQVWIESPFGYCLVVSCYLARAYRLYHVFVRRRLPRFQSWHVVLLLLVPSVLSAAVIQWRRPFRGKRENHFPYLYCSGGISWWLFISVVHAAYICMLIVSTWLLRNIRFEFNESKELLASVCASLLFLGFWLALLFVAFYRQGHSQARFQSTATYILVFLGCATALCFSFFPVLRPLKAYIGQLKKQDDLDSMGHALGVPSSGLILPYMSFRFDESLEALLQHKRFRQAFQAYADSRMAGESIRFYSEVLERNRISPTNAIARIYMAQHIIETYIENGSPMEINISHAMRSDILGTKDLSNHTLFEHAASEVIIVMQTNMEHDFWQSRQFRELKQEIDAEAEFAEQLEWMNVSSKRDSFSTPDNLFEYNGSPQLPHKQGSLSPIHRAFLVPKAALSPENLCLQGVQSNQVENDGDQSFTQAPCLKFQQNQSGHSLRT